MNPRSDQVGDLLDHISKMTEEYYLKFVEAIDASQQTHLTANLYKEPRTGKKMFYIQ